MPTPSVRQLEKQPTAAALDDDLRAMVALAVRVTQRPQEVTPVEVAEVRKATHSPAEYLDAVGVIVGFNFVTRVANALGVESELSPWLRRMEWPRRLVLTVMSHVLRRLVDLRARQSVRHTPAENLQALERLFAAIELTPLPAYLHRLVAAPHLLETQRELFEALLTQGADDGQPRLDPGLLMRVGLVALHETGPGSLHSQLAGWHHVRGAAAKASRARAAGAACTDDRRAAASLAFARQVTCSSSDVRREHVDELRRCGLEDAQILDLVTATALWNAAGKLERLLAGVSGPRPL
jgi:alkylhydroperoxidase family enzyme